MFGWGNLFLLVNANELLRHSPLRLGKPRKTMQGRAWQMTVQRGLGSNPPRLHRYRAVTSRSRIQVQVRAGAYRSSQSAIWGLIDPL